MTRAFALAAVLPVLVFVFAAPAAASGVTIDVDPALDAELLPVAETDAPAWTVEARNPGSVPFTGRVRLDVFANDSRVFRAWSAPVQLTPGSAAARALAFTGPANGSYRAELRLHHGASVTEPVVRNVTAARNASDRFSLPVIRATPRAVTVGVVAPRDVDRIHITVDGPSTRRFAQQTVDVDGAALVTVPVHPDLGGTVPLDVTVMDADGRYRSVRSVQVEPVTGITAGLHSIIDALRIRFHMVLT